MYPPGHKTYLAKDLRSLFCLAFLLATFAARGQWSVFDYEKKEANIQSLLPPPNQLEPGFTFFGTSFTLDDDVITKGFEPFLHKSIWQVDIKEPVSANSSFLYFNVYAINVQALVLRVSKGDSACCEKKCYFPKDGYQVPFEVPLDSACKDSVLFTATIELKDPSLPCRFVVGDGKIYEKTYVKRPSRGYFFYEVTGKDENRLPNDTKTKFGNEYPLKQQADFVSFRGSDYTFELDQHGNDSLSTQKATLQLIRYIFSKYPYYHEHDLNERRILDTVDKIIGDPLPFDSKMALLEKEAKELHDGHFYFQSVAKKELTTSPLILKRIDKRVQVVGIRDKRLENKIALGDRIDAIDHIPCNQFIDSLSDNYFGDLDERRDIAISHLLDNPVNSPSSTIRLEKSNGTFQEVELTYDQQFPIPGRFRPEHFGFYRLENNWAYLKINKWDKGDWIKFYNLKDSLSHNNGIVFDLRGNPGGYESEVVSIASCFLKTPLVYSVETYSMGNKQYLASTIMTRNPFLNLSNLHVIILVDNKTACGSELFAAILKKMNKAVIVGTSKTGSSYSTVYPLQLPDNINLFANILSKPHLFNEKTTLEYTGIVPDIKVDIHAYTDLYGYEDKVLATAKQIIDRSIAYINY